MNFPPTILGYNMLDILKQGFDPIPDIKVMINIGCMFDIPTGMYIKGAHGEHLLLGGLTGLTCICGGPNSFKSTISHYQLLSAMNHMFSTVETSASTYDTEINIHLDRLRQFIDKFEYLKDLNILESGIWVISDKTRYMGDEWYEILRSFLKAKTANIKKLEVVTPFLSANRKDNIKITVPTISEVDSFTEFGTRTTQDMMSKNQLGASETNTLHMKNGAIKTNMISELPNIAGMVNHLMIFTSHMGKEIPMGSGPFAPQPTKKLQHLKAGEKLSGLPPKFYFLMANMWQTLSASQLKNQTKGAEYPKDAMEAEEYDGDLNIVSIKLLRSKSGPSGITLDVIVSQREGVLASLSEYHFIKTHERFGISGTPQSSYLDLYPDEKFARTTIRGKLDQNPLLRRAVNITSELLQMHICYRYMADDLCTPKEIYDFLVKEGYDLQMILGMTRGWWTFNNDQHPTHVFLSTKDLCMMVRGKYYPYWLEDDRRTIKPQFKPTSL